MLRLAVLGLLQKEPLNGYRLKQQLDVFVSCCISVNYGAIYPLLKRIEEQGEIMQCLDEAAEPGLSSKFYYVTSLGRDRWHQEMLSHPQESWVNSRSRFLIKFFFFSHLQLSERVQLIEHRLMTCQLRLAAKLARDVPDDIYQAAVNQRSIDVIKSEIDWLVGELGSRN